MEVNAVIDNLCERFGVAAEYLIPKVSQYLIMREGVALGIEYKRLRCPKCGWESSLPIPRNFCPECGADLSGEQK